MESHDYWIESEMGDGRDKFMGVCTCDWIAGPLRDTHEEAEADVQEHLNLGIYH